MVSFLMVKVQNEGTFLGCKNSNIFFGCLEFLIFFFGCMVDAGPEPTYAEKIRVPPPPPRHCQFP